MERKFCDNCDKEIDISEGYFILKYEYTERDYGIAMTSKIADLCCQKCLVEFAKSKRCKGMGKENDD